MPAVRVRARPHWNGNPGLNDLTLAWTFQETWEYSQSWVQPDHSQLKPSVGIRADLLASCHRMQRILLA